jgi:hypothetical protein
MQMTEQLDWNTLSQTRVGDVERPPMLPVGHYAANIVGQAERGQSAKKQTLFVKFPLRFTEPMDDVDQEELQAVGGLPDKNQDLTMYLTEKTLHRFTDLVKGMGGSEDFNVVEGIGYLEECGEPLVVKVTHEADERNPERVFLRIDSPMPLSVFNAQRG